MNRQEKANQQKNYPSQVSLQYILADWHPSVEWKQTLLKAFEEKLHEFQKRSAYFDAC